MLRGGGFWTVPVESGQREGPAWRARRLTKGAGIYRCWQVSLQLQDLYALYVKTSNTLRTCTRRHMQYMRSVTYLMDTCMMLACLFFSTIRAEFAVSTWSFHANLHAPHSRSFMMGAVAFRWRMQMQSEGGLDVMAVLWAISKKDLHGQTLYVECPCPPEWSRK